MRSNTKPLAKNNSATTLIQQRLLLNPKTKILSSLDDNHFVPLNLPIRSKESKQDNDSKIACDTAFILCKFVLENESVPFKAKLQFVNDFIALGIRLGLLTENNIHASVWLNHSR